MANAVGMFITRDACGRRFIFFLRRHKLTDVFLVFRIPRDQMVFVYVSLRRSMRR